VELVRSTTGATMDEEFLTTSYSADSHRHAILADDGCTGIVYLHAPSADPQVTGEVQATCFAYNRIEPIEFGDVPKYRPNPPPIAKGYASRQAVCRDPGAHAWEVVFSADGAAALLTKDGEPWAMVSLEASRGLSKAIEAPGPWGAPWSDEAYQAMQWTGRTKRCS
jgi:hypothetical protein